jgi:dipeptidase D
VELSGSYPGWTPNAESEILDVLVPIYEKQTGEKTEWWPVTGLECGILGTNP